MLSTVTSLIESILFMFLILGAASLSGYFSEKVGIVNLSIDGQMIFGALTFSVFAMIFFPLGNGTFVIQGAAIGKDSELFFSSDQAILAALGMATIQEGTGSTITATVRDAHTNVFIGKDTITDGVLRGVIKNVDVKLDQTIGSITVWDEVLNKLTFEPNGVSKSTLHLINNPTIAAIGANEGQLLDISIGRLDTTTLNLNNLSVISIADSQKAITKADQALDNINQTRAIIGAQMNRLDYTISNLDVARENMAIADSRIRELDIAEASTRLASEQTILQAASAMLAQANQLPSYAMQLLQ
jgi:flagellin